MWCQMTNVPECRNIIGLKPFGSKCIGTETHQYLSGVKYKRFDDRDKDRWKRSTRKFREDGEVRRLHYPTDWKHISTE